MLIIYFLFSLIVPTKVFINIEKANPIITHTGITFENNNQKIRFDFRAFNDNDYYITTEESRKNITLMFPKINPLFFEYKGFNEFREDVLLYSNEIFLGETNYSLDEIILYENTINKNYILGIYDCRHYVNTLTKWCLNVSIPIWQLDKLIKKN
tara:strand:- start:2061 stop:2522 length:462 start_codon:yes stop_codon:yes gene_type:complete